MWIGIQAASAVVTVKTKRIIDFTSRQHITAVVLLCSGGGGVCVCFLLRVPRWHIGNCTFPIPVLSNEGVKLAEQFSILEWHYRSKVFGAMC